MKRLPGWKHRIHRVFYGHPVLTGPSPNQNPTSLFAHTASHIVNGSFNRRPDKRIRIIALADSVNIINVLPATTGIEKAEYTQSREDKMAVIDNKTFTLDINEFGPTSYKDNGQQATEAGISLAFVSLRPVPGRTGS